MHNLSNPLRVASVRLSRIVFGAVLVAGLLVGPAVRAQTHLKISANTAAVDAYNNWTSGVAWDQIKSFKNPNAIRPVVDLILELQALKAGGLDFDFELTRSLTYELAKTEVVQGHADLTAETIWDDEIAEHAAALLKTDPIIRNGEFVKGVYVLPTNQQLLQLTSVDDLSGCIGAVVSTWALDVKTLDSMKLKGVLKKPTPEVVFLLIQKKQADFTLAEFSSSADMAVENGGVKLIPVPHYTVALAGSRSWIVSKASPQSAAIYKALTAGTKILRDNGTIERAFKECGFFNPRIADWKRLF